jgi:hypothetical protein
MYLVHHMERKNPTARLSLKMVTGGLGCNHGHDHDMILQPMGLVQAAGEVAQQMLHGPLFGVFCQNVV